MFRNILGHVICEKSSGIFSIDNSESLSFIPLYNSRIRIYIRENRFSTSALLNLVSLVSSYHFLLFQISHPIGCFSQFLNYFGVNIFVLWKFVLLQKRILYFAPPPVGVQCYRGMSVFKLKNTKPISYLPSTHITFANINFALLVLNFVGINFCESNFLYFFYFSFRYLLNDFFSGLFFVYILTL